MDVEVRMTVPRFQLVIVKWSRRVEEFCMTLKPNRFMTKDSISAKDRGKIWIIRTGTIIVGKIVLVHANTFQSVAHENTEFLFAYK